MSRWILPADAIQELKDNSTGKPVSNIMEATGYSALRVTLSLGAYLLFFLMKLILSGYLILSIGLILYHNYNTFGGILGNQMIVYTFSLILAVLILISKYKNKVLELIAFPIAIAIMVLSTLITSSLYIEALAVIGSKDSMGTIFKEANDKTVHTFTYSGDAEKYKTTIELIDNSQLPKSANGQNPEIVYIFRGGFFAEEIADTDYLPHSFYKTLEKLVVTFSSAAIDVANGKDYTEFKNMIQLPGTDIVTDGGYLKPNFETALYIANGNKVKIVDDGEVTQQNYSVIEVMEDYLTNISVEDGIPMYKCSDVINESPTLEYNVHEKCFNIGSGYVLIFVSKDVKITVSK